MAYGKPFNPSTNFFGGGSEDPEPYVKPVKEPLAPIEAEGGYGDLSFQAADARGIKGVPGVLSSPDTWNNMASTIMAGSRGAQGALMNMFQEQYRGRAEGSAAAEGAYGEGMGAEVAGQGLSPQIAAQMMRQNRAGSTAARGAALGDARGGYYGGVADLTKGTATELAGLGQTQLDMVLQAMLGQKSADAQKSAGKGAMLGGALGLIGGLVL